MDLKSRVKENGRDYSHRVWLQKRLSCMSVWCADREPEENRRLKCHVTSGVSFVSSVPRRTVSSLIHTNTRQDP